MKDFPDLIQVNPALSFLDLENDLGLIFNITDLQDVSIPEAGPGFQGGHDLGEYSNLNVFPANPQINPDPIDLLEPPVLPPPVLPPPVLPPNLLGDGIGETVVFIVNQPSEAPRAKKRGRPPKLDKVVKQKKPKRYEEDPETGGKKVLDAKREHENRERRKLAKIQIESENTAFKEEIAALKIQLQNKDLQIEGLLKRNQEFEVKFNSLMMVLLGARFSAPAVAETMQKNLVDLVEIVPSVLGTDNGSSGQEDIGDILSDSDSSSFLPDPESLVGYDDIQMEQGGFSNN